MYLPINAQQLQLTLYVLTDDEQRNYIIFCNIGSQFYF